MDQGVALGPTRPQGLLQGVEDEVGVQGSADASAHDVAGEDVDNEGDVHETLPGRDICEVGDPKLVRPLRGELSIDAIERTRGRGIGPSGPYRLATHRAPQPFLGSHQSLDRAAGGLDALALQLPPHLARSIHLQIRLPEPLNVVRQHLVATNPRTAQGRIAAASHGTSISGRGDLQYLADRLDPEALAVPVDETVHHLLRRSSSA